MYFTYRMGIGLLGYFLKSNQPTNPLEWLKTTEYLHLCISKLFQNSNCIPGNSKFPDPREHKADTVQNPESWTLGPGKRNFDHRVLYLQLPMMLQ